jgi:hypothetical protein
MVTANHELFQLMRQATDTMASEYQRIHARSREDPGTAGDDGEENWAELLRHWLPSTYHVVTKGRVISSTGVASRQIDVFVLSPSYPRGLLNKKLYLAAGVLAAFECKNTLRLPHIRQAVETGAELRGLARSDNSVKHSILYGLLAHSQAVASADPSASVSSALTRADAAAVTDPRDCIDFVCIANLGTWTLMRFVTDALDESESPKVLASYMGPLEARMQSQSPRDDPNPLGRFLTGLLRRLGATDPTVAAIGTYFDQVGLFGIGQGALRSWDLQDLPPGLGDVVY